MSIRIGTCPDSWGVWFPDDPRQLDWSTCLDEMAAAGYDLIELGPPGYLPTDPNILRSELQNRGLEVAATFAMGPLDSEEYSPELQAQAIGACTSLSAVGGRFLLLIDATYSDLTTGERLRPDVLDENGWRSLVNTSHRIGRMAKEDFGLQVVFHPHAETHVEYEDQMDRLLAETDPELVNMCLDTGHFAYRGGDPVAFMRRHRDRIPYLHLKSVEPGVLGEVNRNGLPFAEAVAKGVFCEPSQGSVDFKSLSELLREIGYQGMCIVEQDQYPADPAAPLPIAKRSLKYLRHIGF